MKKKDFESIYNRYRPGIQRYLENIVGKEESEDLTQEVFIKVNRSLPNFRGAARLSTWIYRIAANAAFDKLRVLSSPKKNKKQSYEEIIGKEKQIKFDKNFLNPRRDIPADQRLIRNEMTVCVQKTIGALPEKYKTVILLSEIEGFKNKEIAEILGISLDNVKIRLHRARNKLKECLSEKCRFYHNEQNILACHPKQPKKKSG